MNIYGWAFVLILVIGLTMLLLFGGWGNVPEE